MQHSTQTQLFALKFTQRNDIMHQETNLLKTFKFSEWGTSLTKVFFFFKLSLFNVFFSTKT